MSVEITKGIVEAVKGYLQEEGIKFFRELKEEYGDVSPVISNAGIPYAVHFNEGMQIRNFLRGTGLCDNWDCHDLDNNWADIVEKVIEEE